MTDNLHLKAKNPFLSGSMRYDAFDMKVSGMSDSEIIERLLHRVAGDTEKDKKRNAKGKIKIANKAIAEFGAKSLIQYNSRATGREDTDENRSSRDSDFPLNIILYGPPGTGKTYHTINYAVAIIENKSLEDIEDEDRESISKRFQEYKDKKQVEFITFHQSYAYEDFIQGLKPDVENDSGALFFKLKDGVFKSISDEAKKNYESEEDTRNFVLIIDEINRANISRVFGELITLIEEDKRAGQENAMTATLPSGDPFTVPPNLYIIGTMNTADKSIALIDIALRRRFHFKKMYPVADLVHDYCRDMFKRLNSKIEAMKGPDFQIGHSYFMGDDDANFDIGSAMNNKVIPLLYEYFMNDGESVNEVLKAAGITTQKVMGLYEFGSW